MSEIGSVISVCFKWVDVVVDKLMYEAIFYVNSVSDGVTPVFGKEVCYQKYGSHHIYKGPMRPLYNLVLKRSTGSCCFERTSHSIYTFTEYRALCEIANLIRTNALQSILQAMYGEEIYDRFNRGIFTGKQEDPHMMTIFIDNKQVTIITFF